MSVKSVNEIRNYYDICFNTKASRYSRVVNDLITEDLITSNSKILDYGCGTGLFSHYLYKKIGCKIDAVDISKDEIEGAKTAWNDDNINWMIMEDFTFPKEEYDLIISSQVIEHIHNVGNYLSVINKMLKENGVLYIGTPNVQTPAFLYRQLRLNNKKLSAWSEKMLAQYDKGMDHINSWDTYHFTTLLASCGFKLEQFMPAEGVPYAIPMFGGGYMDKLNKRILKNLCYTQHFIFKKVKYIEIKDTD